jgi:hypothetical protein
MGLFDRFRTPKWKSNDQKIRMEGIKELEDEKILSEIVLSDSNEEIKLAVIKNPNFKDQSILAKIAKQGLGYSSGPNSFSYRVASEALDKITDEDYLKDLCDHAVDSIIRFSAKQRLRIVPGMKALQTDYPTFYQQELNTRISIVEKMDDCNILAYLAEKDENEDVREAAVKNNNLNNNYIFADVIANDESAKVRFAALNNPNFTNEGGVTFDEGCSYVAFKDEDRSNRKFAISKLNDEDTLIRIINKETDNEIIEIAKERYLTALFGESLIEDKKTTLENDLNLSTLPITLKIDNLVIDGNGHTIYGGDNTHISINANNITLKNINFKNFSGTDHGGVIKNQGESIRIENCTFENNKIVKAFKSDPERFGGAIDNGGEIKILNCNFKNNQADSGACIHTENGISEIENCIFEDNFANLSGGGALSVFNADIKVKDSTFKKNESRNFSGAIRVSKGNAKIEGSTFIDNEALQHGGAISLNEGTLKIYSSTFERNKGFNGGAINQPGGSLVLNDCIFNDNVSKNGSEGSVYTNGNIEESNCKFKTKNDEIYREVRR